MDLLSYKKAKDVESVVTFNAKNLIENGHFYDGINRWKPILGDIDVIDGILNFIPTTANGRVYQLIENESTSIFYVAALVKASTNLAGIGITYDMLENHSGGGEYERLTFLNTRSSTTYPSVVNSTEVEADKLVLVKNFLTINLTDVFGDGNEPSIDVMDELMEKFPDSWFDGNGNLFNAEDFVKMYLNKMKELDNAIIELGGNP